MSNVKPDTVKMQAAVEKAIAEGYMLRTGTEYRTTKFVGGEKVVNELGTRGVVMSVHNDRPSTIDITCQITGNVRTIKAQDFFQVIHDGSKEAALAARKLGLVKPASGGGNSVGSGDLKLLKQALELNLIDQAKFDAEVKAMEAAVAATKSAKAEKSVAEKAEKAAKKSEEKRLKLAAELAKRGFGAQQHIQPDQASE